MTPITVTLAAYQSLAAARADWDAFELAAKSGSCELVDAALIERTLDEVSEFHFQSPAGWGRGVIASAVCGVLWPPAMLLGALAGSVGGHTMTEVRRGLSHQAIAGLGAVMEKGTFIFVAIASQAAHRQPSPAQAAHRQPSPAPGPYRPPASPWTAPHRFCAPLLTSMITRTHPGN